MICCDNCNKVLYKKGRVKAFVLCPQCKKTTVAEKQQRVEELAKGLIAGMIIVLEIDTNNLKDSIFTKINKMAKTHGKNVSRLL